MERKLLCQPFTASNCSTLARHALKLICQTTFDSILFRSLLSHAGQLSCCDVTEVAWPKTGFSAADDADARSVCLFSFKSILLRPSGKCQSIKRTVCMLNWHGWCHMKLLPSRRVLCTPYNHAPCHFMQSHMRKLHACLAVICDLHFWQNDRDILRATVVTRGWNSYRNKSQHKMFTLEKKILRRPCRDSNPRPFHHESRVLTTELSPLPTINI